MGHKNKGFAPQTLANDENDKNGGSHASNELGGGSGPAGDSSSESLESKPSPGLFPTGRCEFEWVCSYWYLPKRALARAREFVFMCISFSCFWAVGCLRSTVEKGHQSDESLAAQKSHRKIAVTRVAASGLATIPLQKSQGFSLGRPPKNR